MNTPSTSASTVSRRLVAPEAAPCPICGARIENAARCPACGALPTGRLPLRTLRRLAVLLAVLGLVGLHHAARTREIPRLSADALTPSMNFATVRATGVMLDPARIHRRDGEITVLAFAVRDHGAEWQVVAFGDVARRLAESGNLPSPGERVELTGQIRFSPRYGPQLHIRSPDHVAIERRAGHGDGS